jgi:isocitrate lyase
MPKPASAGCLNAFELMKAMIEAGAAGVHFEDQLASVKKCGHMGRKVLVPTREAIEAPRGALAADCMGVPALILARTDAEADLSHPTSTPMTSPLHRRADGRGLLQDQNGLEQAVARARLRSLCRPALVRNGQARPGVRQGVRRRHPCHIPARCSYNCSPSFNWKKNLDDATIAKFQRELGAMGYKFQFITLAGFHSLNYAMFDLAHGYARNQMTAFVELQEAEFAAVAKGFTAIKHQREVGTSYFDAVTRDPGRPRRGLRFHPRGLPRDEPTGGALRRERVSRKLSDTRRRGS